MGPVVVAFRRKLGGDTAARSAASRLDIFKSRGREWLGKWLAYMRAPGFVRATEVTDPVSGQTISIAVGPLFTRLTVNGRDFYFSRFSGKFDGTGGAA